MIFDIQYNCNNTTQFYGLTKTEKDVEMGVCVTDGRFKKNFTRLTGRYDESAVVPILAGLHFSGPAFKIGTPCVIV